jgi:predicted ATPase
VARRHRGVKRSLSPRLYREVLYDHIPPGRRVELHRRIAEGEETAYSERAGEIAAELANHYRRGNDRQKAVQYFQFAGERAAVRSAYAEAIVHFNAGIEEAGRMPEGPDRSRRQLALLLKRGAALAVIKGPQHPEVEETYLRARGIAQSLGDGPELFKAVWGQWLAANMRQTEMARTPA